MSIKRRIVSDAGPLISLEKLTHGYSFIRQLYDVILVPKAVLEEVARSQHESAEAYLRYYRVADLIKVEDVTAPTPLPESERLHAERRRRFNWRLSFICRYSLKRRWVGG